MHRPQVSTNAGLLAILGGFLAVYNDVKIIDFFVVFESLTYGEVIAMLLPFISGVIAIIHNEKAPKIFKVRKKDNV